MSESFRILCPTYWYPEHAEDVHAIYVHDINRHLVRRGHRVRVVTPGKPGLPTRETFDGVEVVRFPFELPSDLTYGRVAQSKVTAWGKISRVLTMARYLAAQYRHCMSEAMDFEPQLVHGHWAIPTGPALVACAHRLGVPSVITLHGGDVYVNKAEGYDFPTRWYVKPVLRWTLRNATALTAISQDCKAHALNAGAEESKIHVVMNGADLRRFSPGDPSSELTNVSEHMLFACRQLFPRKGIRFFIEAAARLRAKYPDLAVVIAGDGFERPELEELARRQGIADRTTFLGWVANKQLPDYYRACAVSVIPSLEEGFGIPAAEAMGCCAPVVATDAGGLPEVVEDGVTGFVVPKADAGALANAIDRLLSDPELRARMGRAGRTRACERFDWDRSASQFDAVYQQIVSQSVASLEDGEHERPLRIR
jgi:glycosyltransferase involved in cell wall biosynthesis